jgi:hypothetical protein
MLIKTSTLIKNLKHKIIPSLMLLALSFLLTKPALAGPASGTYELKDYGFGSGGTINSASGTYSLQATTGEIDVASMSSTNYLTLAGLTYTLEPNTPPAPTITNPSNYYNKLSISINNANNSTDTTFAIQVAANSPDMTQNVLYVQSGSNTLGTTPDWQTYTVWNSGSAFNIIGLTPGTTYYARVAAKRGTFQIGRYGAIAYATTVNPTFTFGVQTSTQATPPYSVGIGVVNAGQVTTSWQSVQTTISTNANNGGLIYINDANAGLRSQEAGSYTINSASTDLTSASEGYGIQGQTVGQTANGPMEFIAPYNQGGNNVGIVDGTKRVFADSSSAPVSNGQATFLLKAKAANSTPAATDYADTITIIGTGSF